MRRVSLADEQGAMAVTIGIVFTVVLAAMAIVLDGGALRSEGAQLQSGADAAAMAVALDCAWEKPSCSAPSGRVSTFMNENADDGAASGTATVDLTAHRARVVATTREASTGNPTLSLRLGSALGVADRGVQASATASWVPRVRRHFVPVPITRCEFDKWTSSAQTTRYRFTGTQPEAVIQFRDGPCGEIPDGLGATGEEYGPFSVETECNPPTGCSIPEIEPQIGQEVVLSIWSPVGNSHNWKFDGFAGLRLTSFVRNNGHKTGATGACSVKYCISGNFTRTSRRDGLPGAFVLGGQVDLVQ